MKWGVRNKTVVEGLKMAIFESLVLLYAHNPFYFIPLFEQY